MYELKYTYKYVKNTHIIVSILLYKYSYNCMYPSLIIIYIFHLILIKSIINVYIIKLIKQKNDRLNGIVINFCRYNYITITLIICTFSKGNIIIICIYTRCDIIIIISNICHIRLLVIKRDMIMMIY